MTEGERDTERNRHTRRRQRVRGGGGTSYVAGFADVGLLLIKECKQCLKSVKQNPKLTNKNSKRKLFYAKASVKMTGSHPSLDFQSIEQ